MDKSQIEEQLKFAEFFDGRYQAKRVILSRSNYRLYEALDIGNNNSRVLIQQFITQRSISESEFALHQRTIETLEMLDSKNLFKIVF